MKNNKKLESALADVRRAYRLLYSFHKRAKDTIDLIADQFGNHTYYKSTPTYTDVPNFRKNPHSERWLWDLFPAYNYSMLYLPDNKTKGEIEDGDCMLEVRLVCDDKYTDAWGTADSATGPDPLKFGSTDEAETSIIMVFWKCTAKPKKATDWHKVWSNNDYPADYEEVESFGFDDGKFQSLDFCFSIADLMDKSSIVKKVDEAKKIAKNKLGLKFNSS